MLFDYREVPILPAMLARQVRHFCLSIVFIWFRQDVLVRFCVVILVVQNLEKNGRLHPRWVYLFGVFWFGICVAGGNCCGDFISSCLVALLIGGFNVGFCAMGEDFFIAPELTLLWILSDDWRCSFTEVSILDFVRSSCRIVRTLAVHWADVDLVACSLSRQCDAAVSVALEIMLLLLKGLVLLTLVDVDYCWRPCWCLLLF